MNTEEQLEAAVKAHEDWTKIAINSTERLVVVENENVILRQLVKDWKEWAEEGFLLLSDVQKKQWEKKYRSLQQSVMDILGVESL